MLNYRSHVMAHVMLAVAATCFAAEAASENKTPETFLLWTATPPGAREGDAQRTKTTLDAIKSGEYKMPPRNRRGTSVPTVDVYLPAKDKA